MRETKTHQTLTYFISSVWFINGLICKVLNVVPRHQEIVARILGEENARLFTLLIGTAEIAMAIWMLSRMYSKLNAVVQIILIACMNIMEFVLAPDLLLWGRANAFFAFLFILLIFYNEYHFNRKLLLTP